MRVFTRQWKHLARERQSRPDRLSRRVGRMGRAITELIATRAMSRSRATPDPLIAFSATEAIGTLTTAIRFGAR